MWKQIYLIYIQVNSFNFLVWIWGGYFSFSLIQFCVLIFSITHLGWTHELVNIWNAAPTCLSALLKTCKQISFRLNNWYHRLLWLHNKWKFPRRGGSLTKLSSKHKADIISSKYIDCRYLKVLDISWAISWDMRACFSRSTSSHGEPALTIRWEIHVPMSLSAWMSSVMAGSTKPLRSGYIILSVTDKAFCLSSQDSFTPELCQNVDGRTEQISIITVHFIMLGIFYSIHIIDLFLWNTTTIRGFRRGYLLNYFKESSEGGSIR